MSRLAKELLPLEGASAEIGFDPRQADAAYKQFPPLADDHFPIAFQ